MVTSEMLEVQVNELADTDQRHSRHRDTGEHACRNPYESRHVTVIPLICL
jgi:hypothetical protein